MSSPSTAGKTPARVTFSCLTPNNVGVVRKLNSVLFPVKYAEKYYKDILALEVEEFCQLGERPPLIALGRSLFFLSTGCMDLTRKERLQSITTTFPSGTSRPDWSASPKGQPPYT